MSLFISSFKKMRRERILILIPFLVIFLFVFNQLRPVSDARRVIENNSFWKKKTFTTKKYNVVICGDSRIYRGISPQHMKEHLPECRILNFGYGSAGYSDIMYREIDKKIDYKSDKKIIILGVTPLTLTAEGGRNAHLHEELNTKREELIELLYFKNVLQFFIPYSFSELEQGLKGETFHISKILEYCEGGWVATYETMPWPESALKSYSTRFIRNQVLESSIAGLVNEIKYWKEHDVQVFAFRPPTTHKMIALEDSVSGYDEEQIRTRLEEQGAVWLEFDLNNYSTFDGSHLQKESAIKFSYDLADSIAIYTGVN